MYGECRWICEECGKSIKSITPFFKRQLKHFRQVVSENTDHLIFSVRSKKLPVHFKREMYFSETGITWTFKVINEGEKELPFQHVMHPLMPLDQIVAIELPQFESVYNEIGKTKIDLEDATSVQNFLLSQPVGSTNMLFLQNIKTGKMNWAYRNGITVEAIFSEKDFPTIGIWWNNNGYPDEEGCRRIECAFEPVPGNNTVLADAHRDNTCLSVSPRVSYSWQIQWQMKRTV